MLTQVNARNRGIAESRTSEQVTSLDLSKGELFHRSTLFTHLTKVLPFRGGSSFIVHRSSFNVNRSTLIVQRSSFIVNR